MAAGEVGRRVDQPGDDQGTIRGRQGSVPEPVVALARDAGRMRPTASSAAPRSATPPGSMPPPGRTARAAAHASALSATVGFVPLHLTWAFGVPLFADERLFRAWYADGGAVYLAVLCAFAGLAAVLALATIAPWGQAFPRWVPAVSGRPVPRGLVVGCGFGVSALLFLYTAYAAVFVVVQADAADKIFSPWLVAYGVPQFLVWAYGLWAATRSYARRSLMRAAVVVSSAP